MTITPFIFEAFLRCPTKCRLQSASEPFAGDTYAEWVKTECESYRADAAMRLIEASPIDECIPPSGSGRREAPHYSTEDLKAAKWRLAVDVPVRIELRRRRGNEAQTSVFQPAALESQPSTQSLPTPAATLQECLPDD